MAEPVTNDQPNSCLYGLHLYSPSPEQNDDGYLQKHVGFT